MQITDKDRLDFLENICNEKIKEKNKEFPKWEINNITCDTMTSLTIDYFNIEFSLRDSIDNAIRATRQEK